jgi:hypothetical protein
MLSRIFWVGLAGIALITGMILQNGDEMFAWTGYHDLSASAEQAAQAKDDRALDRSFDRMSVVGADGQEIDVPAQTKRALAGAVGELIKAETDLALIRIGDESERELRAANGRRDRARGEVDRLKAEIERQDQSPQDRDRLREQIRTEIREDIRATVRDAVRN